MDSLIVLILIMTLPGIIKRLVQQGKPSTPAAPTRRRSAEAPPPVAETDLPPWLQQLAEKLGAPGAETPTPAPEPSRTQRPRFEDEGLRDAEAHPELSEGSAYEHGSWDVTPGADWQRFEAEAEQQRAAAASQLSDREHPGAAPLPAPVAIATPAASLRHVPRHFIPRGQQGWQRAIVLAEILGPPRAVAPWRESAGG